MQQNAKIGGVLTIIAGAFSLLWVAVWAASFFLTRGMFDDSYFYGFMPHREFEGMMNTVTAVYVVSGLIALIGVAFAITGGIYALQRKYWWLAMTGAIFGLLGFFPCGIPAVIFMAMARDEFSAPPSFAGTRAGPDNEIPPTADRGSKEGSGMIKKHLMGDEEFKKFFDDLAMAATTRAKSDESVADILKRNGIEMELPEPIKEKVGPMLEARPGAIKSIPHNCKPCSACGICGICGELNAASGGAFGACIWHVLD